MAYSDFEQAFMNSVSGQYFQDPPPEPVAEPVQLAAGPSATMTDAAPAAAGSVPEMKAYDPTMRERIASFLQAGFEGIGMNRASARKNAQSIIGGPSSGGPLGLGIADLVPFLGTALQTEEAGRSLGNAATLAKQGDYTGAAIEAGVGAVGMIPGAAGTVKTGKRIIQTGKQAKGGAIVDANAPLTANEPGALPQTRPVDLQVGQSAAPDIPSQPIADGAKPVERIQTFELPGGKFATSTELVESKKLKIGFEEASRPDAAAHITAGLRKSPQEQLVALVLDEDDRPIQVIRHTIGLASQTSAEPFSLVGAITNTPGAKSYWLSHNHPSGTPKLSGADRTLADTLYKLTKDTGIEAKGILAIGKSEFGFYSPANLDDGTAKIPAAVRNKSISMMERTFRRTNLLDSNILNTPDKARSVARSISDGQTGVLLMNAQANPVAFIPLEGRNLSELRATGTAAGLFSAAEKANATNAIFVSNKEIPDAQIANVKKFFEQSGINLFDALIGPQYQSVYVPAKSGDYKAFFPAIPAGAATMQNEEQE